MSNDKLKSQLIDTFNTVSVGYDSRALRFFPASAQHLAAFLNLRGDEHILDVACGTGNASLAIAEKLSRGKITAVDFSSGMLEQAKRKAVERNLGNIDFIERDMQALGFHDQFDVAVCAFGIFFVMDMETQLAHIAKTVKPGGKVAITNFTENYFSPYKALFVERMAKYGVQNPPHAWRRIANEKGCRQLFESACLTDIRTETRNVGYYLDSAEDWWNIVWNAGFRRFVSQLSEQDQQRFKQEHLREVEVFRRPEGIWLDVGVLFTIGTKR
jgi:ubiquinone/menaquinone biosynthesis C-methylase UbiE